MLNELHRRCEIILNLYGTYIVYISYMKFYLGHNTDLSDMKADVECFNFFYFVRHLTLIACLTQN